jgi:uncharacterized protein YoxC
MSNKATTQPTVETILERITVLGEEINFKLEQGLDKVHLEIADMRTDILGLKADVKFVEDRLSKLESKSP